MGGGGAVRPPPYGFLPFTQKISRQPIPDNSCLLPLLVADTRIFICGKIFFALIKKIFLQALVDIIFRYHKQYFYIFETPWDPPTTKKKKSENFKYGVLNIKIG